MIQFLADNIDQLDLALDQLAVCDRNFDRFALMLVDNVVELTLHKFGRDKASENEMWGRFREPRHDPKLIEMAIGQNFDQKAKAAFRLGLIDENLRDSILCLHSFRNTAYHKGLRHEGILHSLALFYFINASEVLKKYNPRFWSWGSNDKISHRARKYIGNPDILGNPINSFNSAYDRLRNIAESMGNTLVADLSTDMESTINGADSAIDFLANEGPEKKNRNTVIIDSQAWLFAFTDEAKAYANENGCKDECVGPYVEWLAQHYCWPVKSDPIPSWRRRHSSITREKNIHTALKMYCDFMKQTETIRSQIHESAGQLDDHIQQQIDEMRGK